MEISKILAATLLCLLIISCGGSGTNKKNESDSLDKRNIEILEKRKAEKQEKERKRKEAKEAQKEKFQRNNGNYRKPTQQKKEDSSLRNNTATNPIEEDPAKASATKIEKRVQLELDIWKAKDRDDSKSVSKLREEADDLAKEMTQAELDAAYKRLKDLKKRM